MGREGNPPQVSGHKLVFTPTKTEVENVRLYQEPLARSHSQISSLGNMTSSPAATCGGEVKTEKGGGHPQRHFQTHLRDLSRYER